MESENINTTEDLEAKSDGYQVLVTNIFWNQEEIQQYHGKNDKYRDLPDQFAIDLPENVLNQAKKKENDFNDVVESFIYNFFARRYGHEVNRCQIWLPLDK